MIENNDNNPSIRPKTRCVDIGYLIVSSLAFFALAIYAGLSFDRAKLNDLSMPRDGDGKVCGIGGEGEYGYVQVYGPGLRDRKCVQACDQESQPNYQLGGLCLEPRIEHILKQTGQYQKFIEPKQNTLSMFRIIAITVLVSLGLSLAILVISQIFMAIGQGRVFGGLVTVISVVSGSIGLYFLWGNLGFVFWVALCVGFVLFGMYLLVWRVLRASHSTVGGFHAITGSILPRILLTLLSTMLAIGFACLLTFQYLSFISKSPYYTWQSPALYAEVTSFTWRQALVVAQAIYLISFSCVLNEYLIGALNSSRLGIGNSLYELFTCFLGSVCKLALIRIFLFLPIFLLTLVKPLEGQKCAGPCHCLCGWLLNLARKYSLPVLSYQSAMKETIDLSQAADRLHYQTHINGMEYSEGYIERMAILAIIASAATASVLILESKLGFGLSYITFALALIISLWVGSLVASCWIHAKEGQEIRKVCEFNREQTVI